MTPAAAPAGEGRRPQAWASWLWGVVPPLLLLNAVLAFETDWPGVSIVPGWALSPDLVVGVLALAAWCTWRGGPGRAALHALAALVAVLALLRYGDLVSIALLARPLNLYWDAPHAWQVLRLAAAAAPPWQVGAAATAVLAALLLVHASAHWALARLARHLSWPHPRRWLWAAGAVLGAAWAAQPVADVPTRWMFAAPVTPTLAREVVRLPASAAPWARQARLGAGPVFAGDLAAVRGSDVLVVFAEAYGVVSFDDASMARALAAPREALARAVTDSGRGAVSARVRSPTFGGRSWLAHAELLSGLDMQQPLQHDLLLASERSNLARHFAARGWRSVGWMPGLQRPWPEGAFFGFERLAGLHDVDYRGAGFGFWYVPDQAALALLHEQELGAAARVADPRPRFAVFPTLNSHVPFRPLPPLLDDWDRVLQADAYSAADVERAGEAEVSWTRPAPAYLDAMAYTYGWLGGYLRLRAPHAMVLVVIGDHQPVAAVTGPGASWDVPVHVVTSDKALLRRLEARGFAAGLTPPPATLGPMHALTPLLLEVFSDPAGALAAVAPPIAR